MPRRCRRRPSRGIHEARGVDAVACRELVAALVRHRGDLEQRGADREPGPGRQILVAEIQIDDQIVPGERPARLLLGDQRDRARVHDGHLHVGMRPAVGQRHPAALGPVVAVHAAFRAELALRQGDAPVGLGPDHDRLQGPCVPRRKHDPAQSLLQFFQAQMPCHRRLAPTCSKGARRPRSAAARARRCPSVSARHNVSARA